jgi:hypothetical protein
MSTGRIGLGFSINNFPIRKDFDIRINVKEDFNFMRYGSSFGLRNVGVSFLDSEPINVNDNIIIKDLTTSIPENSPLKFSEDTFFVQTFDLPNAKFLITDVFKTTSLAEEVPLYYKHDLTNYSSISNIEILDGNFEPVNKDLYLYLDEEVALGSPSKSIYTNLRSEYDGENETYTIYYVRFKDSATGAFITNLLNSKSFYGEVTFSTPATERAYSISPQFGLANIVVFFDSKTYSPTTILNSHRFSVKVDQNDRVSVVPPVDLPPTEKWYLRINPGEFFKNTIDGDARYYVPEYEEQLFSPVAPFKLLVEQAARVITTKMLYTAPKPIASLETDGFYIYVIIRDRFGNTTRALTNDPGASVYTTPDGIVTNVFFEKDTIQSIGEESGFIRLTTDIAIDANVFITYRYEEEFYSYRGISVNSTINSNVLNNRIVVYVKPEFTTFDPGGNPIPESALSKTIFHLLVDENDLILSTDETESFKTIESVSTGGGTNYLNDTNSLSNSDDFYTGFELEILSGPSAGRKLEIISYDDSIQRVTVAENFIATMVSETRYRINKKLNDYNHIDPISGSTFNYDGWLTTYLSSPYHNILLADVFAIQTLAPQSIDTTDIRIRGGGVRDENINDSLKLQDQVQWYWDVGYWDGQPYPGMGAMLIELPRNILKEVGGDFSREQVQDITERHIGHGTYPLIKYYDRSTKIIDVEPKDQAIILTWLDIEAGAYNIYVGQNPDQMPLHRAVAGVITTLEIDGLENDKVYYMMVESVIDGVAQLPSRTAFAIPFDPTSTKPPAIYGESDYAAGVYTSG